jgi:hypothetical protein
LASLVSRDGKRFELEAGRDTTIGRSPDNDIVLQHRSVSRRHATIHWTNRKFLLKDLNSSNGTWIGNHKITNQQLADLDIVRLGDIELVFENRTQAALPSRQASGCAEDTSSGRTRARKTIGLIGKCAAAIVALFTLGLGATDLILGRPFYAFSPPPRITHMPDTTVGSSDGMATMDIGRAIIETDRKHAADSSWISVDPTAQMCNRGDIPTDSILCRVAYLGRHAEGKDLDRGPRTIAAADIAEFCGRGAIDPNSSVCAQTSTARRSGLWP